MKFNCIVKVKHNYKKINAIPKRLPQMATDILKDVLENIRGYAIKLEKGHKEDGIIVEMIDMSTKEVKRKSLRRPI